MQALRVTWAFISRGFETDAALCRDTFFSPTLTESELVRYQSAIAASTPGKTRLLDLRHLNNDLPVAKPAAPTPPLLVLGAALDAVVDAQGVRDTATWVGAPPPTFVAACGHDVMLDACWRDAAQAVHGWLGTLP